MQFLSDLYVRCAECEGRRFQPHVLKVKLEGRSVHEMLELTVSEAVPVAVPSVPVTTWGPSALTLQAAPVQEPPATVNVVADVTSPVLGSALDPSSHAMLFSVQPVFVPSTDE